MKSSHTHCPTESFQQLYKQLMPGRAKVLESQRQRKGLYGNTSIHLCWDLWFLNHAHIYYLSAYILKMIKEQERWLSLCQVSFPWVNISLPFSCALGDVSHGTHEKLLSSVTLPTHWAGHVIRLSSQRVPPPWLLGMWTREKRRDSPSFWTVS